MVMDVVAVVQARENCEASIKKTQHCYDHLLLLPHSSKAREGGARGVRNHGPAADGERQAFAVEDAPHP